jgi:hypothetical protein
MKARQLEDETDVDTTSTETAEPSSKASLSTKLERRRRIEDLSEERRLREELTEF